MQVPKLDLVKLNDKVGKSSSKKAPKLASQQLTVNTQLGPVSTNNRNRVQSDLPLTPENQGVDTNRQKISDKRIKPNRYQAAMFKGTGTFGFGLPQGKSLLKTTNLKPVQPYIGSHRDGSAGPASDMPDLNDNFAFRRSITQPFNETQTKSAQSSNLEHDDLNLF